MENMGIIAVNEAGAEEMKNSFQTYFDDIHGKLEEIRNRDIEEYYAGFKSTQAENVRLYVGQIIEAMHTIDKPLLEFKEAIDKVLTNYAMESTNYKATDVDVDDIEGAGDLTGVASFGQEEDRPAEGSH